MPPPPLSKKGSKGGPPPMGKKKDDANDPFKRSVTILKAASAEDNLVKAGDETHAPEALRLYTEGLALLEEAVATGTYNEKTRAALEKKAKGVRKRIAALSGKPAAGTPKKAAGAPKVAFKEDASSPTGSPQKPAASAEDMAEEAAAWTGQSVKAIKAAPVHSNFELTGKREANCTKGDVYTVVEAGHHKGKLTLRLDDPPGWAAAHARSGSKMFELIASLPSTPAPEPEPQPAAYAAAAPVDEDPDEDDGSAAAAEAAVAEAAAAAAAAQAATAKAAAEQQKQKAIATAKAEKERQAAAAAATPAPAPAPKPKAVARPAPAPAPLGLPPSGYAPMPSGARVDTAAIEAQTRAQMEPLSERLTVAMRLLCSKRPDTPYAFLATAFRSPDEAREQPARAPTGSDQTLVEYLESHSVTGNLRTTLELCLREEPPLATEQALEFVAAELEKLAQ